MINLGHPLVVTLAGVAATGALAFVTWLITQMMQVSSTLRGLTDGLKSQGSRISALESESSERARARLEAAEEENRRLKMQLAKQAGIS